MAVTIRSLPGSPTTLRDAMNRWIDEAFSYPGRATIWNDDAASAGYRFPVDIYENADGYVITAALPGANPNEVEITTLDRAVTIAVEIKSPAAEGSQPLYREMTFGKFRRDIRLPGEVAYDRAEAEFQNGVLTLTLPKAEHLKPRTLKVKVAG